jgi:hypothetical protein
MNLIEYYNIQYGMAQIHKWSITEIESMYPFEREIYLTLLIRDIQSK